MIVGVAQFGALLPPNVATRAGRSLVGWADAPPPSGTQRIRQKAAFVVRP